MKKSIDGSKGDSQAGAVHLVGSVKKKFTDSVSFFSEAIIELKKMTYPSRLETVQVTSIILIAVVILSLILWVLDLFFGWLMRTILAL